MNAGGGENQTCWQQLCAPDDLECGGTYECNYIECKGKDPLPSKFTNNDDKKKEKKKRKKKKKKKKKMKKIKMKKIKPPKPPKAPPPPPSPPNGGMPPPNGGPPPMGMPG